MIRMFILDNNVWYATSTFQTLYHTAQDKNLRNKKKQPKNIENVEMCYEIVKSGNKLLHLLSGGFDL